MHCLVDAVIIFVIILILWTLIRGCPFQEHMTRIRRTVSTYNEANETQTAAGVVDSTAIMDYTYSYWDGSRVASCDECPNETVCPTCPQYQTTKLTPVESFYVRGGGESPRENVLDSDYSIRPDYEYISPMNAEYFDPGTSANDAPLLDLDSGYTSSRERMGACTSKRYSHNRAAGYTALSADFDAPADTKFDGAVTLGRKACKPTDTNTVKLLYTDVMGLTNPSPSADNCEFYGANGYLYKEQC